ncbi:MAG TPA: hypothetical protein VJX68_18890 [Candidatus Binatus sp.]|uniref:hypothetical protein n=1 Tax=Candidatus Binatus sp. TaxID=2811406 RepID=UPI002B45DF97|nr:hypothetical protein [Candidatus Binatus sp.]HKN15263.1 hypothetical protein [Candidatus Binatus sp.]
MGNFTFDTNSQFAIIVFETLTQKGKEMAHTATTVLNDNFKRIGETSLDERKRVSLAKILESLKQKLGGELDPAIRFGIYVNDAGQVLLSPEISVPMHELWLYRNREALKMVVRGLEEAREGKLVDLGSFEKYADDDID